MKNTLLAAGALTAVTALLAFGQPAKAEHHGAPHAAAATATIPVTNIADVVSQGVNDQKVTVKGRITANLGDERYTLTDDTGSITVEIDNDDHPAQTLADKNVVISGEIDKDKDKAIEIDADTLTFVD